jgi:hypothetical protein
MERLPIETNTGAILADHQSIGWDLDGTILDHRNAPLMHRYILGHPEKHHFIVTFRSHGFQLSIFSELATRHQVFAGPGAFDGVLSVPDDMYDRFQQLAGATSEEGRGAVRTYTEWKGRICAKHGITVLIDDNPGHVLPGCDRYGVAHIHPDEF